jgi:hypothetical protein
MPRHSAPKYASEGWIALITTHPPGIWGDLLSVPLSARGMLFFTEET